MHQTDTMDSVGLKDLLTEAVDLMLGGTCSLCLLRLDHSTSEVHTVVAGEHGADLLLTLARAAIEAARPPEGTVIN